MSITWSQVLMLALLRGGRLGHPIYCEQSVDIITNVSVSFTVASYILVVLSYLVSADAGFHLVM